MQRKLLRLTTTVLRCRQMTDSREQISLAQGRQLPAAMGRHRRKAARVALAAREGPGGQPSVEIDPSVVTDKYGMKGYHALLGSLGKRRRQY